MFQYALGRALALRNNTELKLDLHLLLDRTPRPGMVFRDFDLPIFQICAGIVSKEEIPFLHRMHFSGSCSILLDYASRKCTPSPGRERYFQFDPRILQLADGAYLDGYWQSPKYFTDFEDTIRKDFTLVAPLPEKILALESKITGSETVCVNVRRTDFVGHRVHGAVEPDYYPKAFAFIRSRIPRPQVFVFSDDLEWCKKNTSFDCPTQFVEHEFAGPKFGHYLWLMSRCNHFIIPNSTFAWWAAWMNTEREKTVVVPKRWFGDDRVDTSDLIPETWARI